MNPYQPPDTVSEQAPEVDPAAVVPPPAVRWAGAVILANGGFLWAMALQLYWFFELGTLNRIAAGLLVALGGLALGLGPLVGKGRTWPTIVATGSSLVACLLTGIWMAWSVLGGAFSPLMAFAALSSAAAALLAFVAIPAAMRVTAARRAIYR